MTELTTGMVVKIAGHVVKYRPASSNQTALIPINYPASISVILLGKSKRQTGVVTYNVSDVSYLSDITTHAVWIVMPLNKHHYFREPLAVLPEQIILPPTGDNTEEES